MSTQAEEIETAVADIAAQLQETHPSVILQIQRIVTQIGSEAAYTILQETLKVEAQGGMLAANKKRRRTPGGIFFHLVRSQVTPEVRRLIWPQIKRPALPKAKPAPIPPLPWDDRFRLARSALIKKGTATTVKISLVGRPGKVIERPDAVILTMTAPKPPPLPQGLPRPPEDVVTVYLVYIARKQWEKVATALQDPKDKLVVDGYPFLDAKLNVIGVLAQNVNTVAQQRKRRSHRS